MLHDKEIRMINAASACTANNKLVIGYKGNMPWRGLIPSDMDRFKKLTMYHSVIMGRKTWDSIPEKFRPLQYRQNIIISRDPDSLMENSISKEDLVSFPFNVTVTDSFDKAVRIAAFKNIWVMGGADIYRLALPFSDYLHQTIIDEEFDGDTFWPDEYNSNEWEEINATFYNAGGERNSKDKVSYWYRISKRKTEQEAA